MPKILFAGSDLGDFTITAGTPTVTSSATYIDTAVSRAGIYLDTSANVIRGDFMEAHTTGTIWIRLRYKHLYTSFGDFAFANLDGTGGSMLRLLRPAYVAGARLQVNIAGTWTNIGNQFSAGAVQATYDIKLVIGSPHSVEFYANNALIASGTFTNATVTDLTSLTISGEKGQNAVSEVMVLQDLTTIGKRLAVRTPTGAGAYSAWTGTFAEVDEISPDDADFITTSTGDAKTSLTMSTTAALTNQTVVGVVISSRGKTDDVTPKQTTHFLRLGGVDYETTAASSFGVSYSTYQSAWINDPSTSAPFDPAVANGATLEIGFKSSP